MFSHCILDLLSHEDDGSCNATNLDDEEDEDDGEEKRGWPSWHTWPLLSRVCFTLGNLTTTNDANR